MKFEPIVNIYMLGLIKVARTKLFSTLIKTFFHDETAKMMSASIKSIDNKSYTKVKTLALAAISIKLLSIDTKSYLYL